jgi:hypothetical protein
VEAGRITPAQALYTARLLDIAGGIADRYARRRVQGIGTHLLATLNAVGIGSEAGNFYTADPNGDAYVERRRVILKQSVLDKLAEVLPASRALIAMDEAQARAELTPKGKLRVGNNFSNFLLTHKDPVTGALSRNSKRVADVPSRTSFQLSRLGISNRTGT